MQSNKSQTQIANVLKERKGFKGDTKIHYEYIIFMKTSFITLKLMAYEKNI